MERRHAAASIVGWLLIAGMVLCAAPIRAQQDPVYERVMREKKLRVFAIQYPPQTYREQAGEEWRGFDADIYRYIAKRLGVELEVVWTTPAAMVPTLTAGRADMGSGLYKTPEREKVIDFTVPYKWVGDHIIVHVDNKQQINSLETLKGHVLAAPRGTAEELAARQIQEAGYAKSVQSYESTDAMFRDLLAKRVDAIVYQTAYFQWVQSQNRDLGEKTYLSFEIDPKFFGRTIRSPSQFPVQKGATKLADAVGKIIVEMRENGELARIFKTYGITEPTVWTPPQ